MVGWLPAVLPPMQWSRWHPVDCSPVRRSGQSAVGGSRAGCHRGARQLGGHCQHGLAIGWRQGQDSIPWPQTLQEHRSSKPCLSESGMSNLERLDPATLHLSSFAHILLTISEGKVESGARAKKRERGREGNGPFHASSQSSSTVIPSLPRERAGHWPWRR